MKRVLQNILIILAVIANANFANAIYITGSRKEPFSDLSKYFEGQEAVFSQLNKNQFPSREEAELTPMFEEIKNQGQEKTLNWITLVDLNQMAQTIWVKLTKCYENNLELIRQNYYRGNLKCADFDFNKQLLEMHEQLYNFLLTSDVQKFDRFVHNSSIESIKSAAKFHPLLAQSLLEFLSTVVRFHFGHEIREFREDKGHYATYLIYNWIDFSYPKYFFERINHLVNYEQLSRLNVSANGMNMPLIPKSENAYRLATVYKNAVLLANIVFNSSDCSTYGLWPEASFYLSNFISWQDAPGAVALVQRNLACQVSTLGVNELGKKELVSEFRKIARKYGYQTSTKYACKLTSVEAATFSRPWTKCYDIDPENPKDLEAENDFFSPENQTYERLETLRTLHNF